jgi:MFS family permease
MNREITTLKPSENKTSKTTTLVVTTIASFLIPLMTSSVNVALPAIGSQYNMNVIALSWVSTAYILASAMLLIPFGRIADIYGRNKIFILGIIVFILGSILALISPTGTMLLVSRAIQGIGGAAIFASLARGKIRENHNAFELKN